MLLQVGFPIMIKATAGGGGRGMRLAMKEDEFLRLLQQAQQEADAAFGNPDMYLERYVQNPRHIEFQVLQPSNFCASRFYSKLRLFFAQQMQLALLERPCDKDILT